MRSFSVWKRRISLKFSNRSPRVEPSIVLQAVSAAELHEIGDLRAIAAAEGQEVIGPAFVLTIRKLGGLENELQAVLPRVDHRPDNGRELGAEAPVAQVVDEVLATPLVLTAIGLE